MLLVQISHDIQTVFTMFYGVGTLAFGLLMYRSGFVPSLIGVLVMLAAGGFVAKAFTWVLMPVYSSPALLAPAAIASLVLSCWLVVHAARRLTRKLAQVTVIRFLQAASVSTGSPATRRIAQDGVGNPAFAGVQT